MKSPVAPIKFVCAQQDSARRGSELLCPSISHHPAREEIHPKREILLPVKVLPKPMPNASDAMKQELLKLAPKSKVIPAKKIKGMILPVDEGSEATPYGDILRILNSLK